MGQGDQCLSALGGSEWIRMLENNSKTTGKGIVDGLLNDARGDVEGESVVRVS